VVLGAVLDHCRVLDLDNLPRIEAWRPELRRDVARRPHMRQSRAHTSLNLISGRRQSRDQRKRGRRSGQEAAAIDPATRIGMTHGRWPRAYRKTFQTAGFECSIDNSSARAKAEYDLTLLRRECPGQLCYSEVRCSTRRKPEMQSPIELRDAAVSRSRASPARRSSNRTVVSRSIAA
jgi:hypothetical protein